MNRELQAFIFDLDGVLVNTVDLHYRAWQQLFAELGISFNRSDMDRFRGVHQRQILLTLVDNLTESQMSDCLGRKDRLYRQLLNEASQTILHTPAANLLQAVKARGLKVGLASSSINAHHVLEIVNLRPLFDVIADGNTVCRSKPAPDIFVWVAGALGLHPHNIVVVEDGAAGVQAALVAGMYVVGIGVDGAAHPPHLNLAMNEVSFDAIASAFAKNDPAVLQRDG